MIKLGCNSLIRQGPDEWIDVEEFLRFAYDLELDVVDFQLGRGFRSSDRGYLSGIKMQCLKYGLPIGYLGVGSGFIASATAPRGKLVGVALPKDELAGRIAEVKEAVDLAAYMGAPMVRLFGGGVPGPSEDREALWGTVIRSFQEIADYAAGKGVVVGLHNHPPVESPTGEDILRILRDTDRENFTFIMDTGRWFGSAGTSPMGQWDPGVDIYEYMEQTAPKASYVRAKIYKIDSGREEWIDYERVFRILRGVGFNGCVSIVYEDQGNRCDELEAVRLAVQHLRELIADTSAD